VPATRGAHDRTAAAWPAEPGFFSVNYKEKHMSICIACGRACFVEATGRLRWILV
jgi:hypothetical protein